MARKHGPFATFSPWIFGSICLIISFWVTSILIGFLWFPAMESGKKRPGFLQLICGGLGWVDNSGYAQQPAPPPVVASEVAWTDTTWKKIRSGDLQRGAAIAGSCAMCHGQQGISSADYIPNLAGLPPEIIYKQLIDYRTGKRHWAMMNAVATGLSDQNMADVAAYYASCPRNNPRGSETTTVTNSDVSHLIMNGDPMRNVVSCAACHGPEGVKTGAPPLPGQPVQYLVNQLVAFSQGTRSNDINRQMRLIVTRLTPEEIKRLAEYLGSKESKTGDR